MRDSNIISGFKNLERMIVQIHNYMQTGLSGATLYEETLKELLMDKGIFTETEFKEKMGYVIKKMQEEDTKKKEAEKNKLLKPSSADTEKINTEKELGAENKSNSEAKKDIE